MQLRNPALYLLFAGAIAVSASAQAGSLNLGDYQLTGRYALPAVAASEASAVTYNWDTGTLFVLGDEGDALVEVSKTGAQLGVMTLTGFDDTEGLTYVGNGKFVVTEERLQDAYQLTYAAGGTVSRSSLPSFSIGATVGNVGIEGISYEPLTGNFYTVKEKTSQAVQVLSGVTFAGTGSVATLFTPSLGVLDLSDIQVLSTVPGLIGTADQDNFLIFSQESQKLLEVSRSGQVLSQFDFSSLADDVEGVTIGTDGTIYLVGEKPELFVLTAVPEPESYALLLAGLGLLGWRSRRKTA